MTMAEVDLYYDPYDPAIDRDPHPVWRRLRDEAPLYRNDRYDFFALSRYADVLAASVDWQTYSSARGTVIEMIDTTPPAPSEGRHDALGMIIFMDPPEHDVLRRLVSRSFTPRRVSLMEARCRSLCQELLDPLESQGSFDYVGDFAAKIPAMMIGALLGVPDDDQDQLRIWGDEMMTYSLPGEDHGQRHASAALGRYVADLVRERGEHPRDDMVSDLLASHVVLDDDSERSLTVPEVLSYVHVLQVAGSETTARLLGWAAVLLARHPEQRQLLVDDRTRIPNGVEELLRYEAPSPIQARLVTRDVEWYGVQVPRYSRMALLTGSAGRDEREFEDPDRFDVTRRFNRHVSFGHGIHFCLGAALARLEAQVVLEETLRRLPRWEVDEAGVELVRTSTVRGPSRVPISF